MPNWCSNSLCVLGAEIDLQKYRNSNDSSQWEEYCEYEELYDELTAEEDNMQMKHFEFQNVDEYFEDYFPDAIIQQVLLPYTCANIDFFKVIFQSKWAPPPDDEWKKISKNNPYLIFHLMYAERGADFVGEVWLTNGEIHKWSSYQRPLYNYESVYNEEDDEEVIFKGPFKDLLETSG